VPETLVARYPVLGKEFTTETQRHRG